MITTVIPVYNTKVDWLKECFRGVLRQTLRTPVLIIDDGSTKTDTVEYCKGTCEKYSNWEYLSQENTGISGAMNLAISAVKTDWLLKVDSDDIALPELTEKLYTYAYRYSTIGAVCSQLTGFDKDKKYVLKSEHPEEITPEHVYGLTDYWIMNHTGVLINKYSLICAGGYPEMRHTYAEDYELWINMLLNDEELRTIPDYLLKYRVAGPDSLSQKCKHNRNDKFLEANRRKLKWLLKS